MKKTLVLALCLIMALCATAFAATTSETLTNQDLIAGPVNVTGTTVNEDVINVVVNFDSLEYVYTNTWLPADHIYTATLVAKTAEEGDTTTYDTIDVINHSNIDINVTPSFTPNVATGITLTPTFTNSAADAMLEEADVYAYGNYDGADSLTYTLSFAVAVSTDDGGATDAIFGTADGVFGTVTITIAKNTPAQN